MTSVLNKKKKLVLDAKTENAKFNKIYADIKAQQKSVNQSIAQKKRNRLNSTSLWVNSQPS